MELNQLHYFVAVAQCENITKAAKELFITQPALSRVIRSWVHRCLTGTADV